MRLLFWTAYLSMVIVGAITLGIEHLFGRLPTYEVTFTDEALVLTAQDGEFVLPEYIEVEPIWPDMNGRVREFSGGVVDRHKRTVHFNEVVSRVCGLIDNRDHCGVAPPKALLVTIHGAANDVELVELPATVK